MVGAVRKGVGDGGRGIEEGRGIPDAEGSVVEDRCLVEEDE